MKIVADEGPGYLTWCAPPRLALLTGWLVWMALIGNADYNEKAAEPSRSGSVRQPFGRDADQLFVKLSYLWRP